VSVGFYPARDYLPVVEFDVIWSRGSKSIILTDEQVFKLVQCLPKFADSVCKEGEEEKPVINCESGSFRLSTPRSRRGLTRLYLGTQYICLTSLDLHFLARMYNIVHQHEELVSFV